MTRPSFPDEHPEPLPEEVHLDWSGPVDDRTERVIHGGLCTVTRGEYFQAAL